MVGTLGLFLALTAARTQAAPVLLAEATNGSGIAWFANTAPAPGTVQFSYRIQFPGGATTEYLTSSYDASTPVPVTFDLGGAALAATIAALQDSVTNSFLFRSTGPDRYDGSGPMRTTSQVFDGFDLPNLSASVIGSVRISLIETCVRGPGTLCATPRFDPNFYENEISAKVRMSVFGPDLTVPEPGTFTLLVAGLGGLALVRRRRSRAR